MTERLHRILCAALLMVAGAAAAHNLPVDGSFSGSWYDPDRSGEGWVLQILDDGRAFVAWFTYPPEGSGDLQQAWLVGEGTVNRGLLTFDNLQQFSGPTFGPDYRVSDLVSSDWGTLQIQFHSCTTAVVAYAGPEDFGSSARSVVRLTGIDDLPCTAVPEEPKKRTKGEDQQLPISSAWFDPDHSGEGWFLEELGDDRVNMYWFTYDDQGNAAWMTGTGIRQADVLQIDEVFLVTGAVFGDTFDPATVTLQPWGSLTFALNSCDEADLTYESVLPGFGSGALAPVRLTRLGGLFCDDAPPLTAGTWREITPMPTPRSEVTTAVIDDEIFVIGGFGGASVMESYNLSLDRWQSHPNMPEGKNHAIGAAFNGEVYVFGGLAGETFGTTDTVYKYSPDTQTWTQLADMDIPKDSATRAWQFRDHIYLIGGTGLVPLRYDPATDTYETLPQPSDFARDHSTTVLFRDEFWLLGGRTIPVDETETVEIFNPISETWRFAPNMTEKRSGFGADVVQGQIMVVGGERVASAAGGRVLDSFEIYVPSLGEFVRGPDIPLGLHGIVAVEADGNLLVLGGADVAASAVAAGRNFLYEPASQVRRQRSR